MVQSFLAATIVGREAEIAAIGQFLTVAPERPHGLLISGETGVGKSRLAREASTQAQRLGFQVVRGACFEQDRGVPYSALRDALGELFAAHPADQLAQAMGPRAVQAARWIPELQGFPNVLPLVAMHPDQEKYDLLQGLTQLLKHLATDGPLLLLIEDLHWSDDATLDFLLHLARRTVSDPILFLITGRTDETHPSLDGFLASLERERLVQELPVKPLSRTETEALLQMLLHQESPLRSDFVAALHELTEGNPFFIEELVRYLVSSGQIYYAFARWDWKPVSELRIPRSVAHTVQRRLDGLSAPARELAVHAAVAGRRFNFSLLRELTQRDEAELLGLIKELIGAQLVQEESSDRFAFRHALTRVAVSSALMARERKDLHLEIAEAMERVGGSGTDAYLSDLAHHFFEAEAWGKAIDYAWRAGQRALEVYAPRAAVEHFTRALAAAGRLAIDLPGVHRVRGQAFQTLGDFEAARSDLEAECEAARKAGDRKAEWQSLTDLGFLWTGRSYHEAGQYFQKALALAEAIPDRLLQAHSLNRLGNWHLNLGRPDEALTLHKRALDVFQDENDLQGTAETVDLLGMTCYLSGDLIAGTDYYQGAIELFHQLDDRYGLASVLATLPIRGNSYNSNALVPAETEPSACIRDGEGALRIAEEIDWRAGQAYALINLAFCLGPQGQYSRALHCAHSALQLAEEIDHRQWMAAAHCVLGCIFLDLLALGDAAEHLRAALALAAEIASSYWIEIASAGLASAFAQSGQPDEAEAVLATVKPGVSPQTSGQRQIACARAELALARGDEAEALRIADDLAASAPNADRGPRVLRLDGLRGEALLRLHRYEEAESALRDSWTTAIDQRAFSTGWRIGAALARLYATTGRRQEARTQAQAVRQVLARLAGDLGSEARGALFLEAASSLLPYLAPRRSSVREAPGGLTHRELEVARLVGEGRTNREIADALIVSERTVETHVSHALSKLGYASRSRIAAWAAEQGLVGT